MDTRILFKPLKVGCRTAPNRIVYQPTETNNCRADGTPTEETIRVYRKRAMARPGIIFIESVDVSFDCQARSNRMVLTEENREEYRSLVDAIRKESPDSLVIFQLSHAGRLSDPSFKPPRFVYARNSGETLMSRDDIKKVSADFVKAAGIVRDLGGDGVDMKQAHGFLAGDFLHPANNRSDEYGGSYENRTRFFRETFEAARKLCGNDFIIGSRISPYEGIPGGCGTASAESVLEDLGEMERFAGEMDRMGVDFINVSAGYAAANLELLLPTGTYPEGVYRHFTWTKAIKKQVKIPVIGSGYSRLRDGDNNLSSSSPESRNLLYFAVSNIEGGHTDFIGLGRQIIADPLIADKIRKGSVQDIQWCTTCSGCGMLLGNNKSIGCTRYEQAFADILATAGE